MNNNENNETPFDELPGTDEPKVWKFHLIMAEVIFNCEMGIQSRRIQFVTKSDGEVFPHERLIQLQKLAASNVVTELREQSGGAIQKIEVEAVHLLGSIDCGWMTEEEFSRAPRQEETLVAANETAVGDTSGNNVVPMRKDPDQG